MAPQVINEYESGKAIPNNGVIARIEKALGASRHICCSNEASPMKLLVVNADLGSPEKQGAV